MTRGGDAATLLARALRASAAAHGVTVEVTAASATRWASATFSGARHALTLAGERSDGADVWLAALPEAELVLRGHLVADLTVAQVDREGEAFTARIEVLTLEEG